MAVANEYDSVGQFIKKSEVLPAFRIWYRDSTIIEEIKRTHHNTDTNGITKMKTFLDHYTFIDLKTGSYYDYFSFSDTAIILKKYSRYDKKEILGMNFYDYVGTKFTRPIETMTDTIIKQILYKRHKLFIQSPQPDNPAEVGIITYSRCDKAGTLFDYGRSMGKVQACPITRMDYMPTKESPYLLSFETEFLSSQLTPKEIKVFDAWEKNAKNNPVHK